MTRAAITVAFLLISLPAWAQTRARMHVGVSGYSMAGESGLNVKPVYRLSGGGGIGWELGRGFTVGTEVSYVVHGGRTTGSVAGVADDGEPIQIPVDATLDLTYLEVPILFGYGIELQNGYRLEIGAGPAFAFKLDASFRFAAESGPEFDQTINSTPGRISGLALALDLIVPVRGERMAVGLRGWQSQTRAGLEDALPGRGNLRTRGVSLVTGIVF
jgi:outer membrane protein with beta-barrel domain